MDRNPPSDPKIGPEYKDTKQLPKPDRLEILFGELKAEVNIGFAKVKDHVDTLQLHVDANHKTVMNEIGNIKDRVRYLENGYSESKKRIDAHSMRVEAPSDHDLENKAELAKAIVFQNELAKKVDDNTEDLKIIKNKTNEQSEMLGSLVTKGKKIINNPLVTFAVIIGATIGSCWAQYQLKANTVQQSIQQPK